MFHSCSSAAAAGFCIDDFTDVTTTEYVLKNPKTGQPTDIVLTLAGPEHPLRKKRQFERIRRMRKEMQRVGKLTLADPAEEEQDEGEFLADCILGWNKMPTKSGDVAYSKEAATKLMGDSERRWLRDQVKQAAEEREAFIASCAGS
jgi:hypothetical protein